MMKKVISIILCIATLVAMLTVGVFAVDEEPTTAVTATQEEQPPKGEIDELFDENEEEPDEEKFNYFKNLWLAFQSATMWTAFFPETLIASLILGIAGPPVAFMTVDMRTSSFAEQSAEFPSMMNSASPSRTAGTKSNDFYLTNF